MSVMILDSNKSNQFTNLAKGALIALLLALFFSLSGIFSYYVSKIGTFNSSLFNCPVQPCDSIAWNGARIREAADTTCKRCRFPAR